MPTVTLNRALIHRKLGKVYTDDEFRELCFSFGIELDGITTEKEQKQKESGKEDVGEASEEIVYKIDIPANRYDLLCVEGLMRALRVFLGQEKAPVYEVDHPKKLQRITVAPATTQVRPIVVAAILRDITFDQERYDSFIDLQEKLHQNVCRKRTLVAIGTHDLDTLQGPFTYEALPPRDITFVPLNKDRAYTAEELMVLYEEDRQLRNYLPIIRDKPVYPVIYDSKRTVLSMPPIINSNHSKITLATRNVLIECTATDQTKAEIVLNAVIAMFSEYCAKPFRAEAVEVHEVDGTVNVYPRLDRHNISADIEYINRSIGVKLEAEGVRETLEKMMLPGELSKDKKRITVAVPVTRPDVMHACDLMEDVAIAFGYNNIPMTVPSTPTVGKMLPINKLTDLLRIELAEAGFMEVLTLALCSRLENFEFLGHPDDGSAVVVDNPATAGFEVCRQSLMPGLLKTVASNKKEPLPLRIFEVSDVVLMDSRMDTGARNERRLAAVYTNKSAQLEVVHGLLDRVMQLLGASFSAAAPAPGVGNVYTTFPSEDATFFPGLQADVFYNGLRVGAMGVVHPRVLKAFEVSKPCSYLEINVEPFLARFA